MTAMILATVLRFCHGCMPIRSRGFALLFALTPSAASSVDGISSPSTVAAMPVSGLGLLDCMLPELATVKGQDTVFKYVLVACNGKANRNSLVRRTLGKVNGNTRKLA